MADSPRSEADVLRALRAGDASAARELVELHQRAVERVVGRLMGRWHEVDDVVQETFIRAFTCVDQIDVRRGSLGWLLQTAVNICRARLRRRGTHEIPESPSDSQTPMFIEPPPDPEVAAQRAGELRRLDRAVARLSPKLREVVLLHYVEELPFREVAQIVGAPVTALKVRALRARAQLRAYYAEEES